MARPGLPPSSEAARLIRALPATSIRDVARKIGKGHAVVASWLTSAARPGPDDRRKFAALYGVPPGTWDLPPGGSPAPRPEPAPRPSTKAVGTSLDEVMAHLVRVQGLRFDAQTAGLFDETIKWTEQERKACELLAKLRGDLSPADETRLTQTPRWASIRAVIVDALRPHPKALADVVKALREVDAMGREAT